MRKRRDDVTTFLLRDVPNDVWRRARSRAVLEGKSIRSVLIAMLEDYAYEAGAFRESADRKKSKTKK